MPYIAAHLLATGLAMVGSFFMNTYWTFQTKPTWKKFAIFPLTNLTNYVVQTVVLAALVEFGTGEGGHGGSYTTKWPGQSPGRRASSAFCALPPHPR